MDRLASKRIMVVACVLMTGLCAAGRDHTIRPVPFRVVYVDDDAGGANDGTSWADAFVHLQDALAVAGRGDRVRVAQGLYKPDQGVGFSPGDRDARFLLVNGATLAGGYAGLAGADPDEREVDRYETILSGDLAGDDGPDFTYRGDNSRVVVASLSDDVTTALEGFTIAGGWGENGAGITCVDSYLSMVACTITRNKTRGVRTDGAGMSNVGGSPVLKDCVFTENFAWGDGGGFWSESGHPVFTDCLFEANAAEWNGGGLYIAGGAVMLERCTFGRNEAYRGAGLYARQETDSECTGCLFLENVARTETPFSGSGGGVCVSGKGRMTFRDCRFEANRAGDGGGLARDGGNVAIMDCTFHRNEARDTGGAIVNSGPTARASGDVVWEDDWALVGCTFTENAAGWGGGALYNSYSAPTLTECTFRENVARYGGALYTRGGFGRGGGAPVEVAPTLVHCRFIANRVVGPRGGGLYNNNSKMVLSNCLLVGNVATDGGGLYSEGAAPTLAHCTLAQNGGGLSDVTGGMLLDHCIVWGNPEKEISGPVLATCSDIGGGWPGEGNLDVDPLFAAPGYWDPNGTPEDPEDDVWVDGDYHLQSQDGRWDPAAETWVRDDMTSPCIDAGDPNALVGDEPVPNGGIVNLGAYGGTAEASKTFVGGRVLYVDDDMSGDGSSWASAFGRLRDALAAARPGDEIRVAQGLYTPTDDWVDREASFELKAGTTVRGGYAGLAADEPNAWDPNVFVTVLSGDIDRNDVSEDATSKERNSYNVVRCEGLNNQAVLEGVVVTGGYANVLRSHSGLQAQGGGLFCRGGCSPRLTDCVFADNYAGAGGAVCLLGTDAAGSDDPYEGDQWRPVFTTCTFLGNRASWGGAVSNGRRWRPVFVGCLWEDNVAEGDGGAIGSHIKADLKLRHCVFRRNDAGAKGGAVSAHNIGRIELVNCLLVANTAADGGGAMAYPEGNYVNEPQVHRLLNCTFYGNTSPALDRPPCMPGKGHEYLPAMTIANCILYGSVVDPISGVPVAFRPGPVLPEIITSICEPGPDSLFVDPLGADGVLGTEDDDFRLASDSPAIDSGSNQTEPPLPSLDLDGRLRVVNGIVDMGAYEFAGAISPDETAR